MWARALVMKDEKNTRVQHEGQPAEQSNGSDHEAFHSVVAGDGSSGASCSIGPKSGTVGGKRKANNTLFCMSLRRNSRKTNSRFLIHPIQLVGFLIFPFRRKESFSSHTNSRFLFHPIRTVGVYFSPSKY